jgi:hypothetical protein
MTLTLTSVPIIPRGVVGWVDAKAVTTRGVDFDDQTH